MRILTLLLISCLLIPELATATVFTPPPTDKSVELLGTIFGTHIGPVYLGGAPNPTLFKMFELFNVIILSIGTAIVAYIGLVSTINTAQEGKTMGKKWNSIWIPMRATLGMLLIIPTPSSGYSVIQTGVMWIILQGIGAADHIWNTILTDLGNGLSVNRAIQTPADDSPNAMLYRNIREHGIDLTEQVLRSAVCKVVFNNIHSNSEAGRRGGMVNLYSVHDVPQATNDLASYTGTLYIGARGSEKFHDICGKYQINATINRSELDQRLLMSNQDLQLKAKEIYDHKQLALHLMFSEMYPVAQQIVAETAKPRSETTNRLIGPIDEYYSLSPSGAKNNSVNAYALTMLALTKPQRIDQLQKVVKDGKKNGWISAGAFYFALNHDSKHAYFNSVIEPPVAHNVPVCNDKQQCSEYLDDNANIFNDKLQAALEYKSDKSLLATRLWDARIYLDNDKASIDSHLDLNDATNTQAIENVQRKILALISKLMHKGNSDPLIAQGKFGVELMVYSENAWMKNISESRNMINESSKDGFLPDEVREKINELHTMGMINISIYSILWIIGATLAIYIPLVPYMIFTVAVVGWFLLVIESVVAAPVLALSFILPSGEELGKIMQGLMLLLNILLRPTLMLFGFILSARLYRAIIELVNFGMLGNFNSLETSSSLFAWVAVVTIYCAFIVALSNKCFALIYALPDKILRWMGGGPEHTDATQELQHAKGTMTKGADTVNKISSGYAEREFARLQSRTAKGGTPADAVRGSSNTEKQKA